MKIWCSLSEQRTFSFYRQVKILFYTDNLGCTEIFYHATFISLIVIHNKGKTLKSNDKLEKLTGIGIGLQ